MRDPIVFYSRCRPQDVDAIEIALVEKRIFIGHPMWRVGASYDPRNLKSCVVDPSCSDEEWLTAHATSDHRRQFNQNRNLIGKVEIGSFALIPRPDRGVVYCGRIVSEFELVNAPPWYGRYMEIRGDKDGPKTWYAADVAQCWRVDEFKPVPLPRIPGWIRRSLFGRSTYGVIHADPVDRNPATVISEILLEDSFKRRDWTLDLEEIEKRLLDDLTPAPFEHLVVSLLQSEYPNEVWIHVGGSGDGGVDGIGVSPNGCDISLLQCKWQYWGEPVFPNNSVWGEKVKRRYLAALHCPEEGVSPDSNCEFLDRSKIVRLVAKHYLRLPQALSMRIGSNPSI